jgi:hypothetical protein
MSRIVCFALVLGTCALASAQTRSLDAALPEGVSILDVRAPDTAAGAARVRLSADGLSPGAILDVWVRPSEAAARALFAETAPQIASRVLVARSGLGEEAVSEAGSGPVGLVLFRRGAVLVAVRTIDPQLDAAALALALDVGIRAGAIGGDASASPPDVQRSADAVAITAGPSVRALVVVPETGSAHRTASGWRASGSGTVFWVDGALRVHALAF